MSNFNSPLSPSLITLLDNDIDSSKPMTDNAPSSSFLSSSSSLLLPFQKELLQEMFTEDSCLIILAKGLGLYPLYSFLIPLYMQPTCLVFLLQMDWLLEETPTPFPFLNPTKNQNSYFHIIDADWSADQRAEQYLKGGVFCITSRILVVDMLNKKIPVNMITGILVGKAETVTELSIESYVLHLLRESNSSAFIRAFSDSPQAFISGFAPLEKALKNLCLRKALFWPRFHVSVTQTLSPSSSSSVSSPMPPLDTVELHIPMSSTLQTMQMALLDLIRICLNELKSLLFPSMRRRRALNHASSSSKRSSLDDGTEEEKDNTHLQNEVDVWWTPETFLAQPKRFSPMNFIHLNSTSIKSKHLYSDLLLLRSFIQFSLHEDPWTFLTYYETSLHLSAPTSIYSQKESLWIYTDTAAQVMSLARTRVQLKEAPMKWIALKEILNEIQQEVKKKPSSSSASSNTSYKILILTKHPRTAHQLAMYLKNGLDTTLEKADAKYHQWKHQFQKKVPSSSSSSTNSLNVNTHPRTFQKRPLKPSYFTPTPSSSSITTTSTSARPFSSLSDEKKTSSNVSKRRRVRGSGLPNSDSLSSSDITNASSASPLMYEVEKATLSQTEAFSAKDEHEGQQDNENENEMEMDMDVENDMTSIPEVLDHVIDEALIFLRVMHVSMVMDATLISSLQPDFIICYDPDPGFVRQIELDHVRLSSSFTSNPLPTLNHDLSLNGFLRVYFLLIKDSFEEQTYLVQLRQEKEAFESLINEAKTLVLPLLPTKTLDSMEQKQVSESRVLVDVREFRSKLPMALYLRGLQCVPCTLRSGDYVLRPDLVIERKSLPDLIQSLLEGRLVHQVQHMIQTYQFVILLIEHTNNGTSYGEDDSSIQPTLSIASPPFSTSDLKPIPTNELSSSTTSSHLLSISSTSSSSCSLVSLYPEITSKLILLHTKFPKLQFLWSANPHQSAWFFKELKLGHPPPPLPESILDPFHPFTFGPGSDTSNTTSNTTSSSLPFNEKTNVIDNENNDANDKEKEDTTDVSSSWMIFDQSSLSSNYHLDAMQLLHSLPGMQGSMQPIYSLIHRYSCFMDLLSDLDQLNQVLGEKMAKELCQFLVG